MDDDGKPERALAKHRKYLMQYALFHVRDPSVAEDAVQETMIAALAQLHTFEGRAQLRTWLTSILKHKIIDLVRRRAREIPADALSLDGDYDASDEAFNLIGRWKEQPSDWGSPDAALESRQFWRIYLECCKKMSERLATVFSMREVMGMSAEEICKKMEISPSNLHVILYRARLSLQSCMTRNGFGANRA